MNRLFMLFAFVPALMAAPAAAQGGAQPAQRPAALEALVRCRAIADAAARLQCYDQAAANLQQAAERRDVVIVDRSQVRETRRRLFGLPLPRLPIFGGSDRDEQQEEVRSIDSNVASAHQIGYGQWVVRLQDGSTWVQTDNNPIVSPPRSGQPVRVVRGALGTFMMRVNGQPGVRVRRQL